MLALFLVFFCFCFVFLFLSCFLFCFQSMTKSCFPCNSGVFWVMLVKRVVCFFFMFYVFVLVCFSCVVSFHFKEFICIILFLCCFFFVTRLSGLLVCILWSFFLFCFLLFCFEFCFFIPLKKDPPKKPDTAKTQKSKNAEKPDNKKTVSAVVFTNSVLQFFGVGLKFSFLAENTIKIVVSAFLKQVKYPKISKNVETKLGPRLSQKLVQVCCAT